MLSINAMAQKGKNIYIVSVYLPLFEIILNLTMRIFQAKKV